MILDQVEPNAIHGHIEVHVIIKKSLRTSTFSIALWSKQRII